MFEKELGHIQSKMIRNLAQKGINLIPEYFYHVPASSSGTHHPSYALGEGGLYRHVQAACGIAMQLFRISPFDQEEQDIIIASLILHDGWKQGLDGSGGKTLHEHPLIAANVLLSEIPTENSAERFFLRLICENIVSHMGQWNKNPKSDIVLPEPKTEMQMLVHLCDYIASRKALEYNFSAEE